MAGEAGRNRQRGLIVAVSLAVVLLAVAAAIFWLRTPSQPDSGEALVRRAQQACLTNRADERGGKATTEAGLKDGGVRAAAGLTATDAEKYEQDARVSADDVIAATERNRACIAQFIAAERSRE